MMRERRVRWAFNSNWGLKTRQCRKGDSHDRTCTDLRVVTGSRPVVSCYWSKFRASLPKQTLETPKLLWMQSGTELSYRIWRWQSHRRARSHLIPFSKGSAAHVVAESLDETIGRERNRRRGPSWTLVFLQWISGFTKATPHRAQVPGPSRPWFLRQTTAPRALRMSRPPIKSIGRSLKQRGRESDS